MPEVKIGGKTKHFPYTKEGREEASAVERRLAKLKKKKG